MTHHWPFERAVAQVFEAEKGDIPGKIKTAVSLDAPVPIWQAGALEECLHLLKNGNCSPRKILPQLRLFRTLVVLPWKEIRNDEQAIVYISRAIVSGWNGNAHPTYTLDIRIMFYKSSVLEQEALCPG